MLQSQDPKIEFINYHGNTSLFALDVLRRHGRLSEMKLFSIACLMPHLADYLALFHTVHHNSITETHLPLPQEMFPAKLALHKKDLFDLDRLDVDCIISHAAIHCFNDSRYGNAATPAGRRRPYAVPAKLRQIAGGRTVPTIVSVSIHREEGLYDNNAHLAHEAFVRSFEESGFKLQEYFFDYVCGGIEQRPEYMEHRFRRSKELPPAGGPPKEWVAGNYYFI